MNWFSWVLAFITCTRSVGHGANILAIFPTASISHQVFYRPYLLALNKRGHNLTVVTTDPMNDPTLKNYREIDISYLYDTLRSIVAESSSRGIKSIRRITEALFVIYWQIAVKSCHACLSDPNVLDIYKRNEKFDLFITEWGAATCYYPFERLADGKIIGISSFQLGGMWQAAMGGVWNPAFAADPSLEYSDRMNFLQRLRSVIYNINTLLYLRGVKWAEANIARQYLGPDVKNTLDIEANVSLVFDNAHVTTSYPRANNINSIPLGGPAFHLIGRRPNPLPKDLKAFLDDAPEGVVYFSLGTNVQTSNISSEEERILMESFGKLKQKVLWKWQNEGLKVTAKNVLKRKWFPQWEILCHPNVKVFVTQAGLQSVGEAMNCQVPLIVMPFFADQNHNARKMESVGAALYLDYDSLDVATFTNAINEIVYNKKYKENMVKFSKLVEDQPIPPLEKAVWWTEYVIRHNGAPHLKSAAATMPWYQYMMLDVLAVVFLSLFIILYVVYLTLKTILRIVFKTVKPKTD